jgi:hypothetical protein
VAWPVTVTYDTFAGVDPGINGATCLLSPQGAVLELEPHPLLAASGRDVYDLAAIRDRVKEWSHAGDCSCDFGMRYGHPDGPVICEVELCDKGKLYRSCFVTVEQLDPLPAKLGGIFANHARGEARGWAWGLTFARVPHRLVRPQTWQSGFRTAGTRGGWRKPVARNKALELDVGGELRKRLDAQTGAKAREKREGLVDAYLLAEWGRRWVQGGCKPQGGKSRD